MEGDEASLLCPPKRTELNSNSVSGQGCPDAGASMADASDLSGKVKRVMFNQAESTFCLRGCKMGHFNEIGKKVNFKHGPIFC